MTGKSSLAKVAADLRDAVEALGFGPPVTHVYNPLVYAWNLHRAYLERFGGASDRILLVGMNPGPFGMTQTGVPFGDVSMVRDWMGFQGEVGRPPVQHPKRLVEGLAFERSEVSGTRLWGWARDRFGSPEAFFERFFVLNYCPLVFLEETGRNRTPDKLPSAERTPLFAACDLALRRSVEALAPRRVLGVGKFAESRANKALEGLDLPIGSILHPSPASPAANRGWAEQVESQLATLGVLLEG
ncbi:MAG: single-stranded DNA-binding protein [Thermoanaerobaculia bacterium]|nr:single-stranded DNA-binding protein [Thermoanaerobaculia bacterium]